MEIHQLRAAHAVARLGSFSRAAEALSRSQPSITLAVQALEKELGTALFERSGRAAAPTAAGRVFLEETRRVLEEWESLGERLRAALGGERRSPRLRVGAGEAGALFLLSEAAGRFRKARPNVEVRIFNQPVEESIHMLQQDELDFALRGELSPPAGLTFEARFDYDRVLIGPRGHEFGDWPRVTIERLAELPFVMPATTSTTRKLVETALAREGRRARIAVEAGNWETAKRYVSSGLGVAVTPSFAISAREKSAFAVRPVSALFGRDVYGILRRSARPLSPDAETLLSFVPKGA